MVTSSVRYTTNLATEAVHKLSGTTITTDPPPDNQGKGRAFSPTDLTATSLACCMLTTIAILADRDKLTRIDGSEADVTKVMYPDPRRIGEIHITIRFAKGSYPEKEKAMYE